METAVHAPAFSFNGRRSTPMPRWRFIYPFGMETAVRAPAFSFNGWRSTPMPRWRWSIP
jgi:hypothetical protein